MTALLQSISEAAASIGVGRSLMYELVATSQVETVRVGRRRLVVVASLEAYVEKLRTSEATGRVLIDPEDSDALLDRSRGDAGR